MATNRYNLGGVVIAKVGGIYLQWFKGNITEYERVRLINVLAEECGTDVWDACEYVRENIEFAFHKFC